MKLSIAMKALKERGSSIVVNYPCEVEQNSEKEMTLLIFNDNSVMVMSSDGSNAAYPNRSAIDPT